MAPPAWLGELAPACSCASSTPDCRHLELGHDRRRALLLGPGTTRRLRIVPGDARALRLAFGVAGQDTTQLRVTLRLLDRIGNVRGAWHREIRRFDHWVDVEVAFANLRPQATGSSEGEGLVVEVEVADGPLAPAGSLAALATPRLVFHDHDVALRASAPLDRDADDHADRVSARDEKTARPPMNVLVYLIDTLRPDHTSTYGYARPTTPHLDRLAREAVVFDDAYTVASWTRPAVASLFTGLHPVAHDVHVGSGLSLAATTLAERFRAGGWATWAFVGNIQIHAPELHFEQGFDRFVSFPGRPGGLITRTSEINESLFRHLARTSGEPFFLYVHAMDPHAPYDPPPGFLGRFGDSAYGGRISPIHTNAIDLRPRELDPEDIAYVRDLYDEDVRFQDEMLGKLLDELSRTGLDQRTIVVVLADHGEELFERGDWEHGERLFEEQIRIPLIVRVPGMGGLAGLRVRERAQIVDVVPTLLRWFGLPPIAGTRGRDLTAAMGPAPDVDLDREIDFAELRPDLGFDLFSVRGARWKLVRRVPNGGEPIDQLFDLARDPGERSDVAAVEPERRAELVLKLAALREGDLVRRVAISPGEGVVLSEETRRQLEALGYVAGSASPRELPPAAANGSSEGRDPR